MNPATLGWRVKRCRESRGWSQADLAFMAGISPWAVLRLERGTGARGVYVSTLAPVAKALEVSLDSLVWGSASELEADL